MFNLLRKRILSRWNPKQSNSRKTSTKANGANVYIHWPYCLQKCTYCNFNTYVDSKVDINRMLACLLAEWRCLTRTHSISHADTLFLGGGTPSLLPTWALETLIREVTQGNDKVEVSLEANPSDLLDRVADLRSAGVTRLSVGVQALDDRDLAKFNRDHTGLQAYQALEESLAVFPCFTSADLMFGRPGQTLPAWRREVEKVLSLGLPHVSLYELTVKRGTKLWREVRGGLLDMPGEDLVSDMYLETVELMQEHGLHRYEVSSFSVAGSECEHNLGYWSGAQYLGLGPGAHSRIGFGATRRGTVNLPVPESWCRAVETLGHGVKVDKRVGGVKENLGELLATGLRTTRGVQVRDWDRVSEERLSLETFGALVGDYGVIVDKTGLRLERDKIAILDHLLPYLFVALDEIHIRDF